MLVDIPKWKSRTFERKIKASFFCWNSSNPNIFLCPHFYDKIFFHHKINLIAKILLEYEIFWEKIFQTRFGCFYVTAILSWIIYVGSVTLLFMNTCSCQLLYAHTKLTSLVCTISNDNFCMQQHNNIIACIKFVKDWNCDLWSCHRS